MMFDEMHLQKCEEYSGVEMKTMKDYDFMKDYSHLLLSD